MIDFNRILNRENIGACLVVGDIIVDRYLTGDVERISPEAPIPVLHVQNKRNVLGGAANVAGNVRGYHVDTYLCGALGVDKVGEEAKDMLMHEGIQFVGIQTASRFTTCKTRAVGMNQQIVRIDEEDASGLLPEEERELLAKVDEVLPKVDVVILSDYHKGVCTERVCCSIIEKCRMTDTIVIVDPKCKDWSKYAGATLITPNFKEYVEALHDDVANESAAIAESAKQLFSKYSMDHILVTRSQHGMLLLSEDGSYQSFHAIQQEVFDVSGAGDTVIASVGALLACGENLQDSVEMANYAAGLSVSKRGTYMVTLEEVIDYIRSKTDRRSVKIIHRENVRDVVGGWRRAGEKIVFTNGCFDILHIGHVNYLSDAAKLGTKMMIGLNSDASVRRLKGEGRPINSQDARAGVLSALGCVDAVVIFDEDTPLDLIREVEPDYLVKGGDYKVEDIVGREYAKEVRTIPLTDGFSTTGVIDRIKSSEEK